MRAPDRRARDRARRVRKVRRRGMLALFAGAASLLAGVWLLVAVLPSSLAEERAFKAAAPCLSSVTAPRTDCLQATWFTIDDIRMRKGRGSSSSAHLSGPPAWSGRVDFASENPLLRRLHPGEQVAGTVWLGEVVTISAQGTRQWTSAHPVGDPLLTAGSCLVFVLAGGLGVFAGRWWVKRPQDCVHGNPAPLATAGWSVLGLCSYAIVLMLWLRAQDAPVWLLPVLWLIAALPVFGTVLYLGQRRALPS